LKVSARTLHPQRLESPIDFEHYRRRFPAAFALARRALAAAAILARPSALIFLRFLRVPPVDLMITRGASPEGFNLFFDNGRLSQLFGRQVYHKANTVEL